VTAPIIYRRRIIAGGEVRQRNRQIRCDVARHATRAALIAFLFVLIPSATYAGTFVAFGPQQYIRQDAKPTAIANTFTVLDPATSFTLRVDSSGVSSAIITLNGVVIFKESDFNANVKLLTSAVTLRTTNQLTVELRGSPGERLGLQIIGVDNVPPTITGTVTPAPNAAGWNKSNPIVTFTCSDKTSGVASCTEPVTVTTETAGQSVVGTAVDKAGNTAVAFVTVKLDKTIPDLAVVSPVNGAKVFASPLAVSGTVGDALSGLAGVTCNGVPATVNGASFNCGVTPTLGANSINATAIDVAGNTGTSTLSLSYAPVPTVKINSPANLGYLNLSPTTVTGTVDDPTATITVNSIQAPVANGLFSVTLPLAEGPNVITATATSAAGAVGNTSIEVTLDTTPPHVTITSPQDKFVTADASITIAGNINDIVVGTVNEQQAQVTVNGAAAQVANRLFLAMNVPLNMGDNVIQAVGRDRVGNAATTQITVTRQAPSPSRIQLISGNNQTGVIGSVLSAPLVVAVTDSGGNPFPNKSVIFKVIENDGLVNTGGPPAPTVIATTNAQGQAQVQWKLGMRAGAGGNSVEAYVVGVNGTAIFTATGTLGPAGKIVIDTGNSQIGEVNQLLPKPLIAVVVDNGNNRLAGVPVTFSVKGGGGNFGGQPSLTVNTDSDGRVAATLTLGFQEGNANNLVEVNFASNTSFPASFTASGRAPGDATKTTISGVVLDNSNVPIPGVTIRAALTNALNANNNIIQSLAAVQTDAQGQFTISQAPVGFVKLMVDGSTAQLPGKYPTLEYDMVTVAGQSNTVGLPIYLLPLNPNNQLCVTATTGGGTLTIPEAPGFSLTFAPGQVTFPGGSKEGCINVTVVHGDKVPMVPGFGQQPRFIVTIQPAGAIFNPPAAITLPNVDGLKPRAVTEMYSFDHDIGSFVAIGTGTVSDDGQVIRSNPGVGVLKAGWHCGGDPTEGGSSASLSVSFNPNSLRVAVTKNFSVTANGAPPLDGKYINWVSDDPTIASFVTTPDCPGQASCTVQLTAKKPGTVTIHVTFICTTTGKSVSASMSVKVMIPTGETTASGGWGTGTSATIHLWNQTLQPADVDFSGIQVTERDPGGGTDGCYFNGSAFARFDSITGGTWTVGANNLWGADYVGWFTTAVTYYRAQNRAPCSNGFPQAMDVIAPSGNLNYRINQGSNQLSGTIGVTTVGSSRNGQSASRTWP